MKKAWEYFLLMSKKDKFVGAVAVMLVLFGFGQLFKYNETIGYGVLAVLFIAGIIVASKR